jgi:NAD(P)H dehydrogenase (quinone)
VDDAEFDREETIAHEYDDTVSHGPILSHSGRPATVGAVASGEHSTKTRNRDERVLMRILWVCAHPEPRSLNAALRKVALRTLTVDGHEVRSSDLYAMDWNPVVTAADFRHEHDRRLHIGQRSRQALEQGTLAADILAEQRKLNWADALVVQFPLWWYGMPAILEGWFDRVFVEGYGYGVRGADGSTRRYGDGMLASGTRACR